MKKNIFTCTLFLLISLCGYSQNPSGLEDRTYWITVLTKIADPVLENMSKGELKKNMPVETISGALNPPNTRTTHLEALGRLLVGMAPWLELGPDETEEGRLRSKYIRLMLLSIDNGFNPESPDYLNFVVTRQPLVDAAFFCQGILRAPKQIWGNLSDKTRQNVLNALQQIRKIKPIESNWLLFSAMVEATLLELTGECNMEPVNYAIMRFKDWYKGDGWYGDGVDLHMDYYNSYVIHPMLTDTLMIMRKYNIEGHEFLDAHLNRLSRYATQLERLISPEGTYPVVGRSMLYRTAVFQALGQACLFEKLPENVSPEQVRCALTAVIKRQFGDNSNFDKNGWLRFGFNGKQVGVAEDYSNTGSLYLCTTGFLPLGLPENHKFWAGSAKQWTSLKAWMGKDIDSDMYIRE